MSGVLDDLLDRLCAAWGRLEDAAATGGDRALAALEVEAVVAELVAYRRSVATLAEVRSAGGTHEPGSA